ncbi:hypothetical protein ACVIGB_000886 [Bradyrhizobium sp. USDA 4341]
MADFSRETKVFSDSSQGMLNFRSRIANLRFSAEVRRAPPPKDLFTWWIEAPWWCPHTMEDGMIGGCFFQSPVTSMRFLTALTVILLLVASRAATSAVLVTVDKGRQSMQVDVDGKALWTWPVSTGTTNGHRTPNGSFPALWLDENHASSRYENAPMPNSIFFTKLGHAIHGSFAVSHLGRPASHGCVRLEPANAKKLFQLVGRNRAETTIVIQGEEPGPAQGTPIPAHAKSKVIARRSGAAVEDAPTAGSPSERESYEVRYYRDRMEPGAY